MKMLRAQTLWFVVFLLAPQIIMAQAFGEYGRAVGGATQRQGGSGAKPPGTVGKKGNKGVIQGVDVGGRSLPSQLIVTAKEASLFPRQDEESEKIQLLAQGEKLVPMVQTAGGNDWFMVKTQKGVIGWVKGSDVREEPVKKQ
jgi:hypothetical protein